MMYIHTSPINGLSDQRTQSKHCSSMNKFVTEQIDIYSHYNTLCITLCYHSNSHTIICVREAVMINSHLHKSPCDHLHNLIIITHGVP